MEKLDAEARYGLLKTCARRQIDAAGGLDAAAELCGGDIRVFAEAMSPEDDRQFLCIAAADILQRASGQHHISEAMARLSGGYFIRATDVPVVRDLEARLKTVGADVTMALALPRGRQAPGVRIERHARLVQHIDEAIGLLIDARARLRGETAKGAGP